MPFKKGDKVLGKISGSTYEIIDTIHPHRFKVKLLKRKGNNHGRTRKIGDIFYLSSHFLIKIGEKQNHHPLTTIFK
jgi:hypothetical protein